MHHCEISQYYQVPTGTELLKVQQQMGWLATDLIRRNCQLLIYTPAQFTQLKVVSHAASQELDL